MGTLKCLISDSGNYKPHREYSEEELVASFDAYQARLALPYDSSFLEFIPVTLVPVESADGS